MSNEVAENQYAHKCSDGHAEIGFNDPDDEFSERCPLCKETDRLVDGIRDHLIQQLGAPADRIDGAGCDSGDPLDFTTAEITQAFGYFEDKREAAIQALRDVVRPIGKFERELPQGSRLDGQGVLMLLKDPNTYQQIAKDALHELGELQ